ncbi:MAG: amidohydrolase [Candidatus Paceibacterota bacterium]
MTKKFDLPLINAHTHAAMVAFRGKGEDMPLDKWLKDCIWPMEAEMVTPSFVYENTKLAIDEMKKNSIAAFMDMYFFEEEVAKAAIDSNFLAVIGEGLIDIRGQDVFDKDLKKTEHLLDHYKENKNVIVSVAPHSPYTVNEENLVKAKDVARKYDAIYQIHISETKNEVDESMEKHGLTPVEYLYKLGVLDARTVLVHCVWLTKKDIQIIADAGCSIVHCPLSNLKLGSGIAPVADLLDAGINVAIGTDGAASSNRLDVWEAGKFAALLQKGVNCNPLLLPARTVLEMMTVNGMKALGIETIGGKRISSIRSQIDEGDFCYLYDLNAENLKFH